MANGPVDSAALHHVPDGDGGYLCECPDSECCPEDRPNPLGPHVQVVKGWLDDNGCLLPDPDGITLIVYSVIYCIYLIGAAATDE